MRSNKKIGKVKYLGGPCMIVVEELLPRWNCVYTKGRVVFILLRVRIPLVAAGTLKP